MLLQLHLEQQGQSRFGHFLLVHEAQHIHPQITLAEKHTPDLLLLLKTRLAIRLQIHKI